jgi:hypothetical protein
MPAEETTASLPPSEEARPRTDADEPMLYCPVCSTRLNQRKCKLFCEQCGYYMSCADYY